jgi:hypothetical protein
MYWDLSGAQTTTLYGAVSLNAWHHVALTWDGTTLTGYVDGVAKATASASSVYTDDNGPIRVLNQWGYFSAAKAGKDWIVDELVVSKTVRTIDPALYAPKFVRCSALDAGAYSQWPSVTVTSPTPTSTETWGLYVQASNSATVPAQTDPGWQQAAIGQSGNQVIDLSSLNLSGRYLHRMWYLNPSLDTKKWYQASIGACEWSYAPVVSGQRGFSSPIAGGAASLSNVRIVYVDDKVKPSITRVI